MAGAQVVRLRPPGQALVLAYFGTGLAPVVGVAPVVDHDDPPVRRLRELAVALAVGDDRPAVARRQGAQVPPGAAVVIRVADEDVLERGGARSGDAWDGRVGPGVHGLDDLRRVVGTPVALVAERAEELARPELEDVRLVDVVEGRVRLAPDPAAVGGRKRQVRLRAAELDPRLTHSRQQDDAGAGLGDALERARDALERRGADDRGAVPRPAAVVRREDPQLVAPVAVVVRADGQQEGIVSEDGESAHPAGARRRHRSAVPGAAAVRGAEEPLLVEVPVGAAQPGVEPDGGPDVAVAGDAHAGLGAGGQAGIVEDDALRREPLDDLAVERHGYRIAGHGLPPQAGGFRYCIRRGWRRRTLPGRARWSGLTGGAQLPKEQELIGIAGIVSIAAPRPIRQLIAGGFFPAREVACRRSRHPPVHRERLRLFQPE